MNLLVLLLVPLLQTARGDSSETAGPPAAQGAPAGAPAGALEGPSEGAPATTEPQWKQPPGLGLRALLWSNRGPIRHLAGVVRKAAYRLVRGLSTELKEYADGGIGPPAGRRKKDGWPLLAAGLIMGGTLLTIGLGALAAMSGKALMSAMLALGMSLMSAFRGAPPRRCRRSDSGCSDDGDSSRYEIIARPVITHGHTHSAVLHHDPAPAYPGYVRSLAQSGAAEQMTASLSESSSSSSSSSQSEHISSDPADFARSGSTRLGGVSVSHGSGLGSGMGSSLGSGLGSGMGSRSESMSASGPVNAFEAFQSDSGPATWTGGVMGMKSAPSSDSVLNLTLGTWGRYPGAAGAQPSSQPRALSHSNSSESDPA